MSKQEEARLILKLYELRREAKMREARDWYFMHFHPQTVEDFMAAMFSDKSGCLRMVISYWDMAAALVLNGAIDIKLFADTNGEMIGVFARIEPLLPGIRAALSPRFALNLEKLIDTMPEGRKLVEGNRAQMEKMKAHMAAK
jgi:hypothetical protein